MKIENLEVICEGFQIYTKDLKSFFRSNALLEDVELSAGNQEKDRVLN